MKTKTFEVRDAGTFIPVLAIKLVPADERDRYLLARAGFGRSKEEQASYVVLIHLVDGHANHDPYCWPVGRTMEEAHKYIKKNFDSLQNGAVVDVEFILGITDAPKASEQERDSDRKS